MANDLPSDAEGVLISVYSRALSPLWVEGGFRRLAEAGSRKTDEVRAWPVKREDER